MAKKASAPRKAKRKKVSSSKSASAAKKSGAPTNEQDTNRRLGNFSGAGEHARQGGRTSGIVGQTKQKNRTDRKSKKK
jgi:hypothetical protein